MKRIKLDNEHWTKPNHRQRMEAGQWGQLLLSRKSHIIYLGRVFKLKAKNLGYGMVEVYKELGEES